MFSYALPAISPGPLLTILALYLNGRLNLTQAEVNQLAWIPPLTWGLGYFFWGWAADRYAANNNRPVGMFLVLTIASLTLGFVTMTTSVPLAMALIALSTFIGGGFQMVALKVGSYAFPRERAAMMTGIASGSWSLVNFVLLRAIGPWTGWMNGGHWEEIFWLIAVLPAAGIAVWYVLSWNDKPLDAGSTGTGARCGLRPSSRFPPQMRAGPKYVDYHNSSTARPFESSRCWPGRHARSSNDDGRTDLAERFLSRVTKQQLPLELGAGKNLLDGGPDLRECLFRIVNRRIHLLGPIRQSQPPSRQLPRHAERKVGWRPQTIKADDRQHAARPQQIAESGERRARAADDAASRSTQRRRSCPSAKAYVITSPSTNERFGRA